MSHFVLVTYGQTSKLNKLLFIARALATRNHTITFVSSLDIGPRVREAGHSFRLLDNVAAVRASERFQAAERAGFAGRVRRRRAHIAARQPLRDAWLHANPLSPLLFELQPDLVLLDDELYPEIITTIATGFSFVLTRTWYTPHKTPGIPPLNSTVLPDGTLRSHAACELAWLQLRTKRLITRRLLAPLFYAGTDREQIAVAMANQLGIDIRDRTLRWQNEPLHFRRARTLHTLAPDLEFRPPASPADTLGPCIDLQREAPDSEFDNLLDSAIALCAERDAKLVYCALGSMIHDISFFHRVIAGIGERRDLVLLLATGRNVSRADMEPLPENVFAAGFVPQLKALRHADVMINHAGIGTIEECLLLGVPMVVYSMGVIDMNGCAARVAYHGVGVRGDIRRDTPDQIVSRIGEVLASAEIRANVRRMQHAYQALNSAERVANLIESAANARA